MKTTPLILAAAFVASAMAVPVAADPPGNYSITFEFLTASYFDFKDGVGIANPSDQDNDCTALLLGLRGIQPLAETWEVDQNMGTNLNGPGVGISNLVPPLATPQNGLDPTWLPNSGGIDLGIECPIPGASPGNIWLVWSGVNWRSAQADSSAVLNLCTQKTFPSSSPGCLAIPDASMSLLTSACPWDDAFFGGDYADSKGKYISGIPFDTLRFKSDVIKCTGVAHSHDYTNTIQDFTAGGASQTFDIIKNEAVVHTGSGHSYMAVCWQITYLNFSNPIAPTTHLAQTHDWKLILDLGSLTTPSAPGRSGTLDLVDALQRHYGGAIVGDNDVPLPAVAMRGFYSDDAGDPKDGGIPDGQNGFGPCTPGPAPEPKKPSPIV